MNINDEIKAVLIQKLAPQDIYVTAEGSHFQLIIVSELFADMTRKQQQQTVYVPLMEYIADNRIHALSIKTYTPQEWERDRKLHGL